MVKPSVKIKTKQHHNSSSFETAVTLMWVIQVAVHFFCLALRQLLISSVSTVVQ